MYTLVPILYVFGGEKNIMFAFLSLTTLTGSRGSLVGVVTSLRDSIPRRSNRFLSPAHHAD